MQLTKTIFSDSAIFIEKKRAKIGCEQSEFLWGTKIIMKGGAELASRWNELAKRRAI